MSLPPDQPRRQLLEKLALGVPLTAFALSRLGYAPKAEASTTDDEIAALMSYINLQTPFPAVHGSFKVRTGSTPYLSGSVQDDQMQIGYNLDSSKATEPQSALYLEVDYPVTVRNTPNVRTMETYLEFVGRGPNAANLVTRPIFFSYSPQIVAGQAATADGFLNYGYILTGNNLSTTTGGGGLKIMKGDGLPTDPITAVFDAEGSKLFNLQCFPDSFMEIDSASQGANMVITTTQPHNFNVGTTLGIYSYGSGPTAGTYGSLKTSAEITVIAVTSSTSLITDFNNSGAIFSGDIVKIKAPEMYTAAITKLGVGGRSIISETNNNVLDVAGPSRFAGAINFFDYPGQTTTLSFNKLNNAYQVMKLSNLQTPFAFGYFSDNKNAIGFGASQNTDSAFAQRISYASISPNGLATGRTSADSSAWMRIGAGDASRGQLKLNQQSSPFVGTVSDGVVLWSDGTDIFICNSSGTRKLATTS